MDGSGAPALKELLEAGSAALVVIDMQNDFCHEDGVAGRDVAGPWATRPGGDIGRVQAIVPPINRLLDSARAAGVKRFIVRTEHSEETDSPAWLWRAGRLNNKTVRAGSWGAELYGIAPGPGDVVVTKHRYSAFVGTDLLLRLRTAGLRSVVLTGTVTNVCVESTARDALMADLFVIVVEDAVGATLEEDHQAGITSVRKRFGLVCSSDEVCQTWSTSVAARAGTVELPAPALS